MKDRVIENYQRDEEMMILIFAQWCVNHDLNPVDIYERAYPSQKNNEALKKAIDLTVSKEEADHIPNETLLAALSMFGNEELAFVVSEIKKKG
ncbi:hypothetical protein BKP35_09690 [Anaerobacillus arseniciselenatis]|uniref:YxiS n=1 Tax=Anaerobacillus arseniciselenatis TaxID=85682 RepID=A0A1S2LKI5_9BACI|nr:hypothetical protein [Anaerobacillus arseniciselenatis]OIJ12834.1 hypothetical protein BKP35_09690 [Anaerobacillus arseniciselenatis]